MPYTLKSNRAKFRNANGEYKEFDLISENSTAEQIAAIETKGAQTLASIPADYTTLSDSVDDLESAVTQITEDKTEFTTKVSTSCNTLAGGYIRAGSDSNIGRIYDHSNSTVYWFQVQEDTFMYYSTSVSGMAFAVSDKQPAIDRSKDWATDVYGIDEHTTPETAVLVPANYYIACSRYNNSSPLATFYLSPKTGEIELKHTLPLTEEMSNEVDDKIENVLNGDYIFSANGAKVVERINKTWGQSACLIDDKIVSFTAGYNTEPINGSVYVYNKDTMATIRSFHQQIGHCPCADFNEETDTIITTGAGGKIRPTSIYLIKNATQIIENGTDIEYGVNAVEIVFNRPAVCCFGETSDYIYAISSAEENPNWRYDPKKYAYKIKLGKGSDNLVSQYAEDSFGTFISGCGANEYNGTAHIEATFVGSFAVQFQGAKYYGGKMLLPCDVMINGTQKSCVLLLKYLANGKIKIFDDFMFATTGMECQDVLYLGNGIYATRSANELVKFQMFI